MKIIFFITVIISGSLAFSQDTTKTPKRAPLTKVTKGNLGGGFAEISLERVKNGNSPRLVGAYFIERSALIVKQKTTKAAEKVIGSFLKINASAISGSELTTIPYQVTESSQMDATDYIFRLYGEIPKEMPDDLPKTFLVHKTNNPACYGIAVLANGTVLLPYNGLLLYLIKK